MFRETFNEAKHTQESILKEIEKALKKSTVRDHGELDGGIISVELDSNSMMVSVSSKELDALAKKGIKLESFTVYNDTLLVQFKV